MPDGTLDTYWVDGAPVTDLGMTGAGALDTYWCDGAPVTWLPAGAAPPAATIAISRGRTIETQGRLNRASAQGGD